MQPKTYFLISAIMFGLVSIAHMVRIVNDWPSQIGVWPVPMFISWGGLIIAGFLSFLAFRLFFRS